MWVSRSEPERILAVREEFSDRIQTVERTEPIRQAQGAGPREFVRSFRVIRVFRGPQRIEVFLSCVSCFSWWLHPGFHLARWAMRSRRAMRASTGTSWRTGRRTQRSWSPSRTSRPQPAGTSWGWGRGLGFRDEVEERGGLPASQLGELGADVERRLGGAQLTRDGGVGRMAFPAQVDAVVLGKQLLARAQVRPVAANEVIEPGEALGQGLHLGRERALVAGIPQEIRPLGLALEHGRHRLRRKLTRRGGDDIGPVARPRQPHLRGAQRQPLCPRPVHRQPLELAMRRTFARWSGVGVSGSHAMNLLTIHPVPSRQVAAA